MEFGTIMLWYFVADRTTVFYQGKKVLMPSLLAYYSVHLPLPRDRHSCCVTRDPAVWGLRLWGLRRSRRKERRRDTQMRAKMGGTIEEERERLGLPMQQYACLEARCPAIKHCCHGARWSPRNSGPGMFSRTPCWHRTTPMQTLC